MTTSIAQGALLQRNAGALGRFPALALAAMLLLGFSLDAAADKFLAYRTDPFADVDAILVRSATKVDAEALAAAHRLKVLEETPRYAAARA